MHLPIVERFYVRITFYSADLYVLRIYSLNQYMKTFFAAIVCLSDGYRQYFRKILPCYSNHILQKVVTSCDVIKKVLKGKYLAVIHTFYPNWRFPVIYPVVAVVTVYKMKKTEAAVH